MRIWLSSYPRSGNTLLRTLIHNCFGLFVGSIYDETSATDAFNRLLGRDVADPANTDISITKTHGPPTDDAPAIYVVRNGMASIDSYFHFLRDFTQTEPSLEDVVNGDVAFGSWSSHYRLWDPENRPGTLLLRYEDFSVNPAATITRLAKFLDRSPRRAFTRSFAGMKLVDPTFFRVGGNKPHFREFSASQWDLFERCHGEAMIRLGYWSEWRRLLPSRLRRFA